MRRYLFFDMDGSTREWDAEMDTLREGAVILSKKKEATGVIARTDVQPEIVAVYSMHGFKFYIYAELADDK